MTRPDAMAIVVVTHQSSNHLASLAEALDGQLRSDDEIVIVDNASTDDSVIQARSLFPTGIVIPTGNNAGFAAGCHIGVEATQAPLLLFVNPDSRPAEDCIENLRRTAELCVDWSAWQAAVLIDEEHVNSSGGVVHYLGIGWAGDCGSAVAKLDLLNTDISFPSGAAMVVRRDDWNALGGMDSRYFMYGEDLDFGLRLWLSGRRVGFIPGARVHHGYEFDKGAYKWFWLERNRWRTVLSVYPLPLLAMLLPALLAAEVGLLAVAARGGWLGAKLRAQLAVLRDLPWIFRRRRQVQKMRRVNAAEFARHLTSSLDSPYLATAHTPIIDKPQALYWRLVRHALAIVG